MKLSGFLGKSFLLLLLAAWPASLAAISVFDVIRLSQERYSDEEIVTLIRTTDSRFVLSAEDTIRLRKEGVTETVIREMLSRPAATREEPPASKESAVTPPAGGRREILFSASSPNQRDAGHPVSARVTLAGMEILTLRDRDGFSSPLARARAVAATLNDLAGRASGRFAARTAGPETRVAFESSGRPAADVLAVTRADAAEYRAADGRQVSAASLATLWASVLNDYWGIFVTRKSLDSPGRRLP